MLHCFFRRGIFNLNLKFFFFKQLGEMKEDLKLPEDEDSKQLVGEIKESFAAEKSILISVIATMGKEKVSGYREDNK